MFTGIVAQIGEIKTVECNQNGRRFLVQTQFSTLEEGESISVDGVCLTVTAHQGGAFYCDLSPETLAKSIASRYEPGRRVNIERAMRLSDRVGGHLVSGHVDEVAEVVGLEANADFWRVTVRPTHLDALKYVVVKGSVTLNGVSLTINDVNTDHFTVMLIPQTLEMTNLKALQVGSQINVEYDMLAKLIEKQIEHRVANV